MNREQDEYVCDADQGRYDKQKEAIESLIYLPHLMHLTICSSDMRDITFTSHLIFNYDFEIPKIQIRVNLCLVQHSGTLPRECATKRSSSRKTFKQLYFSGVFHVENQIYITAFSLSLDHRKEMLCCFFP